MQTMSLAVNHWMLNNKYLVIYYLLDDGQAIEICHHGTVMIWHKQVFSFRFSEDKFVTGKHSLFRL